MQVEINLKIMQYSTYICGNAVVKFSEFKTGNSNGEIHAIAAVSDISAAFQDQLKFIVESLSAFQHSDCARGYVPVAARIILSDASNQAAAALPALRAVLGNAAVSYVQQAPMNYAKLAVIVYLQENAVPRRLDDNTVMVERNGFCHYFSASVVSSLGNPYSETACQLGYLENMLLGRKLNIADNCVRTWFFVQNIDVNYGDVVRARRENFDLNGLTVDTHYIASTGICGRHACKDVTSILDAYSIGGIVPGQMNYLYAADNMNRTSDYGVTFERGTYVDFADRREIFISGTASINNRGEVVAEGDIKAQTFRMIENVEALLAEAGASLGDIAHIVCYLRDSADYPVVSGIFASRFGDMPYVITLASVCRPGWLIEMECVAVAARESAFGEF